MSKGDWEVEERQNDDETPAIEMTSCQMYGHTYEAVTDGDGAPIVGPDGGVMKRCNDCNDTYEDTEL